MRGYIYSVVWKRCIFFDYYPELETISSGNVIIFTSIYPHFCGNVNQLCIYVCGFVNHFCKIFRFSQIISVRRFNEFFHKPNGKPISINKMSFRAILIIMYYFAKLSIKVFINEELDSEAHFIHFQPKSVRYGFGGYCYTSIQIQTIRY